MNKTSDRGAVPPMLPTVERPVPAVEGTDGLRLLRRLMREAVTKKVRLEPAEAEMLKNLLDEAERSLHPARPAQIAELVQALSWHYPSRGALSPEANASVAKDWLRDLGHLPEDILDAACSNWRRGPNSYAPMPGHLLAIADPILNARRLLRDFARRYLGVEASA